MEYHLNLKSDIDNTRKGLNILKEKFSTDYESFKKGAFESDKFLDNYNNTLELIILLSKALTDLTDEVEKFEISIRMFRT